MLGALAVTAVVSAMATGFITPVVIRFARWRGILDMPDGGRRRIHTEAVPRLGGLGVVAGTGAGLVAFGLTEVRDVEHALAHPEFFLGVVIGAGILLFAGATDDVLGLRPTTKLLSQILAAVVLYAFGFSIESIGVGEGGGLQLGMLSLPLTIFWVVAVTNAFNLIDGMDGLATGLALVALSTLLAVAFVTGRMDIAVVCVALVGALFGFLPFNFNPARIFLGDSGSLFVGFMLAVLSMHGATTTTATALALVPLFMLALPLIDTALALLRRWLRGLPLAGADRHHIHHRLLEMGFTTRGTVALLYCVAAMFALVGALLAFAPPTVVALITLAGGALTLAMISAGVRRLDYHEFSAVGAVVAHGPIKLRKVLSDRIHAQDLARVISAAKTLEEINAVLADSAEVFRFGHIEVCRLHSPDSEERVYHRWQASAWKLDHPVSSFDPELGDWYVLRIWCRMGREFVRPYGAERVAGILGPVVEAWMAQNGTGHAVPIVGEPPQRRQSVKHHHPPVTVGR